MKLVLAITGASGALAAKLLTEKSPWPVALIASRWGKYVYQQECKKFQDLVDKVDTCFQDEDLMASVSSGSVKTAGMVILPCSSNTMARIAQGTADTLITRAAHCHLKERRSLVLCVRESPWTLIDIQNAEKVSTAGGIVMPFSPPFYMFKDRDPKTVNLEHLLSAYVDRVLSLLGHPAPLGWDDLQ